MPILSTKRWTHGGKSVLYHESGGSIINPSRGIRSDFIESSDVYFIKLMVPKTMTQRGHPPPKGPHTQEGLARPGVVGN